MPRHLDGFTLIELLVTVAIITIVLSLASPSFAGLHQRTAITAQHNLLMTSFATARSHAVHFSRLTTLCPGTPTSGCRTDGVWDHGWMVFVDADGNGEFNAADTVVLYEERVPDALRIRSSKSRAKAVFRPDGSAAGTNLTVRLCVHEAVQAGIVLSNVGRARKAGANELAAMPGCD